MVSKADSINNNKLVYEDMQQIADKLGLIHKQYEHPNSGESALKIYKLRKQIHLVGPGAEIEIGPARSEHELRIYPAQVAGVETQILLRAEIETGGRHPETDPAVDN